MQRSTWAGCVQQIWHVGLHWKREGAEGTTTLSRQGPVVEGAWNPGLWLVSGALNPEGVLHLGYVCAGSAEMVMSLGEPLAKTFGGFYSMKQRSLGAESNKSRGKNS